jgi:hypothetical protein
MKKILHFKSLTMLIAACMPAGLMAQQDIIFDPAELIPADTGYYIGGVWKDKNLDGIDEFYNLCVDEYGDSHHWEWGEQQGFTYNDCMIMPTCWPKDADEDHSEAEIDHPEGYIELTKTKYVGTDSARMGYIISPAIENLVSLTLETSPDVSYNDQRSIKFWVEYSTDNGETWEASYIEDETRSKKGDARTYDGSVYVEFGDMKAASAEGPIVIRIMSKPLIEDSYVSQRVKIHWLKIVADPSTESAGTIPYTNPGNIRVFKRTISATGEIIQVFNITGQHIGYGKEVTVKDAGIYIVRMESGAAHKVFVK